MKSRMLVICILFLIGGCASLPPNTSKSTYAFRDTADTRMGNRYRELKSNHAEESGFFLLSNGLDAFTARAILAQGADRSIDVQYYMIHNDLTGLLFADQLLKAADRGVRIRLLIDDMDLDKRDEGLSTLAAHPNIHLRIFNPFSRHISRAPQFLFQFGSVTRRMHNKSFTVDNQATIVGGRNIGDEYFDADPDFAFADLDILAIGFVVKEVSDSFDEYWNSSLAYPIKVLRPDLTEKNDLEKGRKMLTEYIGQDSVSEYLQSLLNSRLAETIRNDEVLWYWGEASVMADNPGKLESYDSDHAYTLSSKITPFFENLDKEFLIFSPYFVPGKEGTKFLADLSKSGVRVRILTNSLASTDVGVVHAGYAKYRTTLLRAGVELYEMNKTLNRKERKEKKGASGSSKASLHAKSFVFDREQVFIGSLNLDPRSIVENTEIGIMVTSKEVADILAGKFDMMIDKIAFRLELHTDEEGIEFIFWHGQEDGEERVWAADPYTSFWRRLGIGLISLLPVESQL
ncbi:MAG: phospholipase D family protein [Deltaproteobacteria bacterium]|nr:phospholipase D family protein [Deltaproteobacteria bacterium]